MKITRILHLMAILITVAGCVESLASEPAPSLKPEESTPLSLDRTALPSAFPLADNPNPPSETVKLVFVHHSTGGNWLADVGAHANAGGLGRELMDNNYYVSATNYGWSVGGDAIGDRTDIGHWWDWFRGPNRDVILAALYNESGQNVGDYGSWPRLTTDPVGENEVIMFKSCFPNSHLGGSPDDAPTMGENPLRGQDAWSEHMTVANAKGIYNDILTYFATRQDKLFIVITAPPLLEDDAYQPTDAAHAANARAFNQWLVNDWLDGYAYDNVAVFDFYNVLTSNGGSYDTNDLDAETGNHHRWWSGTVQHLQTVEDDFSAYAASSDSHPTGAGGQKATAEFVPLLNVYYHRWKSDAAASALDLTAPAGGESWPVSSVRQIRWTTTGTVTHVSLAYSGDGFVSSHVISAPVVNSGLFTWTTPATPTTSAQVRVASFVSPAAISDTGGIFTLYDPAALSETISLPLVLRNKDLLPRGHLIYSSNLIYKGAFAYPPGDDWAYSGHALAYYPSGDPSGPDDGHPGSLYVAGHSHHDLVGEVTIPEPLLSGNFDDLPKASALRPLTDTTAGWKDNCTYNGDCIYREVDGLAYLPNVDKIVWNLRDWYNTAGYDQDSLGWSELDMTGAQGVWHIGARGDGRFHNAKTSNYLFKAPESFASANLEGKWLIAGNHREGGALGGSQGPTLYALAPWEDGAPPTSGQDLDALALLYYPEIYDCVWSDPGVCHFPGYRAKDDWGGGAWVQTAARSGILIFGRKGLGDSCYGTQAECAGDPCDMYKGFHAYPYEPQILFYDPEELKEVLSGTREPWQVLPYEIYSPMDSVIGGECARLGAAAYDQARGFLYVAEPEAGPSGETVVHVWEVR